MIDREQLVEHLKFFAELGVDGISRDPAWRARPAGSRPAAAPEAEAATAPAVTHEPPVEAATVPAVTHEPSPVGAAAAVGEPPAVGAAAGEPLPASAAAPVAGQGHVGEDRGAGEVLPAGAAARPPERWALRTGRVAGEARPVGAAAGEPRPAGAATGKTDPPPAGASAVEPPADDVPEAVPAWTTDSLWDAPAAPAAPGDVPPAERLQGIRDDLGDCTRCKLHGGRTNLVFGVGNPGADLMFVGEAPGRDEDLRGEPFVGRAGQLLTRIIEAIDLRRGDVYIANVVKCRPPQNRNPERDEVETCRPFLLAQIDAVRPRVVVALGTFAIRTLLDDDRLSISRARGRVYKCRGARLVPTFHPAFLLRSPDRKRDVWEDMKRVRSILRGG